MAGLRGTCHRERCFRPNSSVAAACLSQQAPSISSANNMQYLHTHFRCSDSLDGSLHPCKKRGDACNENRGVNHLGGIDVAGACGFASEPDALAWVPFYLRLLVRLRDCLAAGNPVYQRFEFEDEKSSSLLCICGKRHLLCFKSGTEGRGGMIGFGSLGGRGTPMDEGIIYTAIVPQTTLRAMTCTSQARPFFSILGWSFHYIHRLLRSGIQEATMLDRTYRI